MVASGIFLVMDVLSPDPGTAFFVFPASILVNLLFSLAGKFNSFASEVALLASREMTRGRFRNHYWWGGIVLGHIVPLALLLIFSIFASPVAVLCVIGGLFFYEYAFVMAPQYIPNS
jgi:hypothetical protein